MADNLALKAEAALAAFVAENGSRLWEDESHTLNAALRILREHAGTGRAASRG